MRRWRSFRRPRPAVVKVFSVELPSPIEFSATSRKGYAVSGVRPVRLKLTGSASVPAKRDLVGRFVGEARAPLEVVGGFGAVRVDRAGQVGGRRRTRRPTGRHGRRQHRGGEGFSVRVGAAGVLDDVPDLIARCPGSGLSRRPERVYFGVGRGNDFGRHLGAFRRAFEVPGDVEGLGVSGRASGSKLPENVAVVPVTALGWLKMTTGAGTGLRRGFRVRARRRRIHRLRSRDRATRRTWNSVPGCGRRSCSRLWSIRCPAAQIAFVVEVAPGDPVGRDLERVVAFGAFGVDRARDVQPCCSPRWGSGRSRPSAARRGRRGEGEERQEGEREHTGGRFDD